MWLPLLIACASSSPAPTPVEPAPAAPASEPDRRLVLVAVGDVLPHRRVKQTAADHGWGTLFADVAPMVRGADVAFANLESPVAPEAHKGLHGEVFNAPPSLLDGLAAAGFDVVSMANNHVFDQGPDGLVETWTRARQAGLQPVGAGPTCAEARAARVVEVAGARVAFLAAADLVNLDLNAGEDAPCLFAAGPVCAGDCGPDRDAVHFSLDEARLVAAVRAARASADIVVMSFHWGDEYRVEPLPEYPRIARVLVDAGVDVLIGHHPHVLQPVEELDAADGRRAVVAYSLGNFVSDMARTFDPTAPSPRGRTRDGAVLAVSFTVPSSGRARIDGVRLVPTWTDNTPERIVIRTHAAMRADAPDLVDARWKEISTIVAPALLADDLGW